MREVLIAARVEVRHRKLCLLLARGDKRVIKLAASNDWTFFPRKIYLRLDWLYRRSTAKASCCLVFSKVDVFSRKRPVLVGLDIVLGEL